jgi:hypothetical protein
MRRSEFLRLSAIAMLSYPLLACQGGPSVQAPTPTQPSTPKTDPSPTAQPPLTPTAAPTATARPVPTSTPIPPMATPTQVPPTAVPSSDGLPSFFDNATLLTIYGRAWGSAPVLGRLALYDNIGDMASEIADFSANLSKANDGRKIVPVIHLIYGMATPCDAKGDCLYYLDTSKTENLLKDYIEPAVKKGYLVILDTQYGRADSLTQVRRMIDKGYLKYDNVHVALDPEFHVVKQGQTVPGQPIGTVSVDEINAVQALLDDYVDKNNLPHRKILMVHQFGDPNVNDGVPSMIQNKKAMKTYPNVDLIICADGFGSPDSKITKYNKMTDSTVYPFIQYRAIKLFLDNPKADKSRIDKPVTTFRMCFGIDPGPNGAKSRYKPDCIVIA